MPLTQRPVNGMMNILSSSQTASSGPQPKASKPPKRLIPNDQLAAFKVEVEGSDLTKLALIEALKKKYASIINICELVNDHILGSPSCRKTPLVIL